MRVRPPVVPVVAVLAVVLCVGREGVIAVAAAAKARAARVDGGRGGRGDTCSRCKHRLAGLLRRRRRHVVRDAAPGGTHAAASSRGARRERRLCFTTFSAASRIQRESCRASVCPIATASRARETASRACEARFVGRLGVLRVAARAKRSTPTRATTAGLGGGLAVFSSVRKVEARRLPRGVRLALHPRERRVRAAT